MLGRMESEELKQSDWLMREGAFRVFSRQNRNGIEGFERKWIVMVRRDAREMRLT